LTTTPASTRDLRDAFGLFATGVTIVTARRPDGSQFGMTANSFTSVSLEPALLLWCLASNSSGVAAFSPGAAFAVHVLCHEQRDLALRFSRRTADKFEGHPNLAGALCRFDCRVHALHDAGDHLIVIGEVLGLEQKPGTPLAFHAGRFGSFRADRGVGKVDVWEGLENMEDHWY
jgi:3-hydroxy-9,10-secoandrosta-1,3,5(10)-triene-9,17-dione monooxygenase reductase component